MNRIAHWLSGCRILRLNRNFMVCILFMNLFLLIYILNGRPCCVLNFFVDINWQQIDVIWSFTIFCILHDFFAFQGYIKGEPLNWIFFLTCFFISLLKVWDWQSYAFLAWNAVVSYIYKIIHFCIILVMMIFLLLLLNVVYFIQIKF